MAARWVSGTGGRGHSLALTLADSLQVLLTALHAPAHLRETRGRGHTSQRLIAPRLVALPRGRREAC